MLATPGERGVIGRGQVETQHPEDRRQEAFSLPQGQVEDEPERQRGFDGEIGILPLPATFADAHGLPSGDRIRGHPHGDIAALDQRSVVCRPIPDVVFCLVLWVHSRLHVEIMHLLSPRWPGGRSWLTEGAGSVHQRPCAVLLAPAGRRASDPAAVRRHAAEDLGATGAGRLTPGLSATKSAWRRKSIGVERCLRDALKAGARVGSTSSAASTGSDATCDEEIWRAERRVGVIKALIRRAQWKSRLR